MRVKLGDDDPVRGAPMRASPTLRAIDLTLNGAWRLLLVAGPAPTLAFNAVDLDIASIVAGRLIPQAKFFA
jgi:hypothetical protein